ncbi:MAG: ATP-binding protein [Anaerolineales bacterium]
MSPVNSNRIALWGPSGVGKTTLIRALACELSWLNRNNPDFSYELTGPDGQSIRNFWTDEYSEPTKSPEDFLYTFRRVNPGLATPLVEHQIVIFDDKGNSLIRSFDSDFNRITELSLRDARFVIAIIDPTLILETQRISLIDTSTAPSITKSDYLNYLRRLLSLMGQNNKERRYLAICLSKMDLFELRWQNPKVLAELFFGETFLHDIDWQVAKNISIQYFSTSAMGFVWDNNYNEFPNFDIGTGLPKFKYEWRPWNITAPFFWMFSQIETQETGRSSNYPAPFY